VRGVKARPPPRLSREAWIAAALDALADGGEVAVRIEALARRLRVTKGSFYWHFRDRRELLAAGLERWEADETTAIAAVVEARGGGPVTRLRTLFDLAFERRIMALEVALRGWAQRDRRARAVAERVDRRRLAYLRSLYVEGGLAPGEAEARSFLAYAMLFGESFVRVPREARARAALVRRCGDLLLQGLARDAGRRRGGRPRGHGPALLRRASGGIPCASRPFSPSP
jgi:AcrR family transcriptional regulator